MPSGYLVDRKCCDYAEPANGPTVRWLKQMSKTYQAWIGTTYLGFLWQSGGIPETKRGYCCRYSYYSIKTAKF
ncbi:hypothetical protein [Halothermothrix orenii]|uniref:hypothetical protein n=1 Tax=Halothermothrix orenii TaxID=31909 RepID=UPI0005A24177|nr:hypothetical protein [Halothermothrix orenii]